MMRYKVRLSLFLFLLSLFLLPFPLSAQQEADFEYPDVTISMDFKDASLKDVLKIFSMQSGLNFIASEAVEDRNVTLYLDKVDLKQVMEKLFVANNLTFDIDKGNNIFIVKDLGKPDNETVTKVFYLKHATVSSSSVKEQMAQKETNSSSSESESSSSDSSDSEDDEEKGKWKVEEDAGITSAVKQLLTKNIGYCMEDFRTNSLIVTDTPMKMKVIAQVIASLDVAEPQVMLEVEMLDVSKNTVDKLGFEFGDSPFTAILTGASASTGFPFGSWSKVLNAAKGSLAINTGANTYQMQLDYMRTQTDTKYLARPKLLTLNNETAEIYITKDEIVGREDTTTYDSGTPTTTSEYQRSTDLKLTPEGTGIFLKVTPQINLETNEVTMVVNPKSSVSSTSDLSQTDNPQADIEIRSTKSVVKVRDGETVVLGGLIHQDKKVVTKKLPILGDIPFLGVFFRHKYQEKDIQRELIVFITPHIIRNSEAKSFQMQKLNLPMREQGAAPGLNRDYLINSSLNNFDKKNK